MITTSQIESYTLDANSAKEIVLEMLEMNGVITPEIAVEYNEKWQIVVVKKGWFKRWLRSFDKQEESEEYMYKMVKFEE